MTTTNGRPSDHSSERPDKNKSKPRPGGKPSGGGGRPKRGNIRPKGVSDRPSPIGLRRVNDDVYELIHPRCVEETELDYKEGIELWKAGEPEEARDALRYALEGCRDNLWLHAALGALALRESRDPSLARGHYGYAVELVQRALPPSFSGRLPRDRDANRPFFEALEGLIASLEFLGKGGDVEELRAMLKPLS